MSQEPHDRINTDSDFATPPGEQPLHYINRASDVVQEALQRTKDHMSKAGLTVGDSVAVVYLANAVVAANSTPARSKSDRRDGNGPTGIQAAEIVADYIRLRGSIDDEGDAANIIHILHQAGVCFALPARDAAEGAFPIGEDTPYWRALRATLVLPVEEQYAIAKDLAANCGYELTGDAYTATPQPAPPADGAKVDACPVCGINNNSPFPCEHSPSATGAAEPDDDWEARSERSYIDNTKPATPPVSGDRELLERIKPLLEAAASGKPVMMAAVDILRDVKRFLSLPVQAGEREAVITEDDGTRDPLPKGWKPPIFDHPTVPPLTMRSALEQIKIVCIDNAATTVRHDLALEFVGGIATRALSRQPPQSIREG